MEKYKYAYGQTFERIRKSNAWICKKEQGIVTHISFISYETPIMPVEGIKDIFLNL